MREYVRVENSVNLVRDMRSSAILETDVEKLKMHRAIKSSKTNELNSLKEEINLLKESILMNNRGKF